MLAYLENNRHDFDFNECRPQKIMKRIIQNPIFPVKFPAEHVPGVRKCKATYGKRGKAVQVFFSVLQFSIFFDKILIFNIFFPLSTFLARILGTNSACVTS